MIGEVNNEHHDRKPKQTKLVLVVYMYTALPKFSDKAVFQW